MALLTQERHSLKQRLKEEKELGKHKPRLFTKNIMSSITSIRGTACPVTVIKQLWYPD